LTLPDFFIDHDKPDRQIEIAGLDTTHIVTAALQALGQDDVVSPAVPA
jgi:1-deoxy-D-xylulose-5-phosphate synthase